jgi:predicted nucleotidyltransferase
MKTEVGLKFSDLETMLNIFKREAAVEVVVLFGSRAKGNFKPGSDVDIALKGSRLTTQVINRISYQLNEETIMPYRFDVLNYHTITEPALIDHIDRVGKTIYQSN